MNGQGVTLGELRKGLNNAIKLGVSEGAVVLWTDVASAESIYCRVMDDVIPGSVLLGLEFFKDGEVERGTLQISPAKLSEYLN